MDKSVYSIEMHGIQERIIKTDEVIRLLDVKKKEVNKLDKKYKKILEKFCIKSKEVTNLNSSWEKKHGDLLIQKELLLKNHNEYINDSENKYQSACQEIQALNEKCDSLKKKIEKFEQKDKVKNSKKLHDSLKEAKEQLTDSLLKYSLLENTSKKTIYDLKEKTKCLEQQQNATLKQLAKLRLEYDALKKSQENSPSLRNEIEELETKLESSEIELDILKQAHETDIADLKRKYEQEVKLLQNEIEKYKNGQLEETNKENETEKYKNQINLFEEQLQKLNNHIDELTEKHKSEMIIKDKYINETKLLTQQLEELKNQINTKTNTDQNDTNQKSESEKVREIQSTKETSTQTEDEDIYDLEDIITEMHDMPALISPLSVESEEIIKKTSRCVAVGSDIIIPTLTDSYTDNCAHDFNQMISTSTQTIDYINNPNEIEFKFQPSIVAIPKNNVLDKIPKNVLLKSRVTKKYKNSHNSKLLNSLKNSKLNLKFLVEKCMDTNSKFIILSPSILKSEKNKFYDSFTSNMNYSYYNPAQFSNRQNFMPCSCQMNMCWNKFVPLYSCNCTHGMYCNNFHKIKKSKHFDDISSDGDEDDKLRLVLKKYKYNLIKKYVADKYLSKLTKMKKHLVLDDSEDDDLLNFLDEVMRDRKKTSKKKDKFKHTAANYKLITSSSDSEIDTVLCSPKNKGSSVRRKTKKDTNKTCNIPSFNLQENNKETNNTSSAEHCINVANKEQNKNKETNNTSSTEHCINVANKEQNKNKESNNSISIRLDLGITEEAEKCTTEISSDRVEINKKVIQPPKNNVRPEQNYGNIQENPTNLFTLSKRQRLLLRKAALLKGNKLTNSACKKPSPKMLNTRTAKRKLPEISQPEYKKQKKELFGSNSDDSDVNQEVEKIPCSKNNKNALSSNLVQNKLNDSYTPNISRVVVSKKVDKSGIIDLLSNKQINKSEVTNKVFKKPETNKLNVPPCKDTEKLQNETEYNILKDLPEPEEFITYNTVEKTNIKVETPKLITIDKAQKLISDVATNDWDKDLIMTASEYLADQDPTVIARLIVNQAAQDFSQQFDKTFTPPAPLLTTTQQKILVLLDQLEKRNMQNIYSVFLQVLERRLLPETRLEIVHSLTRLYVTACKLKYDIEKIRMFCCNSTYYMGDLILPVMFIILTTWGDVLPMAENADDIPLATVIVQVIRSKTCKKPGFNGFNLNRLLTDYYGYKVGEHSDEEIMIKLIENYSATLSNTACTAIVILCKNMPNKWTCSQIKNHLLPLVNNCESNENKMKTVSLIQRLINKFDKNEDYVLEIKHGLSNFVTETHSGVLQSDTS